ncbi:hypothetical protein SPBR_03358 [Sporothrix brasiliensis 5110]|uniref:Uncharacterized protein n=1 Tax=Sporothrix brasiliensis 5110 TaxID=1398154 RepID=A0A0C2FQ59_9PEZI|nr:uncharacterized protein SPBR_03358 [Sporothrix brasiliensis 5110]KIH93143.1 hypothetical protein SPBR_03358 [Sporothrix brasiliensis 5110]
MPTFIERIQSKLELFRLEKRYTRSRNRRSTFVSNAIYVDGEYVYQTPASTGSSFNTSTSSASRQSRASRTPSSASPNKLRNRLSMPSFGSLSKGSSRTQDWQTQYPAIDESR